MDNSHIAKLDIYEKELEGLVVVEVEFSSLEDANTFSNKIPKWFGKKMTNDKKYKIFIYLFLKL